MSLTKSLLCAKTRTLRGEVVLYGFEILIFIFELVRKTSSYISDLALEGSSWAINKQIDTAKALFEPPTESLPSPQ